MNRRQDVAGSTVFKNLLIMTVSLSLYDCVCHLCLVECTSTLIF
nr:MAG TPA: hypothetical protein [Caudoviricetes sp.]